MYIFLTGLLGNRRYRAASMAKYLSPNIDQYIQPSKFFNDLK